MNGDSFMATDFIMPTLGIITGLIVLICTLKGKTDSNLIYALYGISGLLYLSMHAYELPLPPHQFQGLIVMVLFIWGLHYFASYVTRVEVISFQDLKILGLLGFLMGLKLTIVFLFVYFLFLVVLCIIAKYRRFKEGVQMKSMRYAYQFIYMVFIFNTIFLKLL